MLALQLAGSNAKNYNLPPEGRCHRLGKSPRCHLQLEQDTVSRNHAEIGVLNDKVVIRDCNSTNGTFLDNVRVQKDWKEVRLGSTIRLGEASLQLAVAATPGPLGAALSLVNQEGTVIHPVPAPGQNVGLGRAPNNELVLPEPTSSRYQARLRNLNGVLQIFEKDTNAPTHVSSSQGWKRLTVLNWTDLEPDQMLKFGPTP